jgi:lipopolysaccharide exporter
MAPLCYELNNAGNDAFTVDENEFNTPTTCSRSRALESAKPRYRSRFRLELVCYDNSAPSNARARRTAKPDSPCPKKPDDLTTLRRKMIFGAAWMMSVRFVDRGIGLVSTVILARVLLPTDFGIVAMAMGVVALLELFASFGFDTALIQSKGTDRALYDTAWTFNFVFGVAIGLCLVLLAWPAAAFYQQPSLAWVICALAAAPPLQGLDNVGLVAFRRDLNFKAEFLIMACKRLMLFAITISLAFTLRSYWALVIGIVVGRGLGTLLGYFVHPYRPRFSLAARRELLGFSKWMLANNFLQFGIQRASDVIVGRALGPRELGLYNVGAELANLPASELVAPINRAVFPGFARLAADRTALRTEYLMFIGLIAILAIPAAVGVAAIAPLMVPLVLGPNWLDAIDIVRIVAIAGALQVMQTTNYAVYLSVGKPERQGLVFFIQLLVLLPTMYFMVEAYGTIGAAGAYAISCIAVFPFNLAMLLKDVQGRLCDFARQIWRPAVGAAIMYAVVQHRTVSSTYTSSAQQFVELVYSIALGAMLYSAALLFCWAAAGRPASAEALILSKVKDVLQRFRSRPA